jgi:hypothetical protein
MPGLLTGALTALLSEAVRQWLTASARRTRARRSAGVTIHPVTLAGRLIFDAAILIMGGLAVLVVYHREDWRIAALVGAFALLCLFAYPGPIVVDPRAGVRMRRWYGRTVEIVWRDVVELRGIDPLGQSTLISRSGRKIVHTSLHADGDGFCREVRAHAPLTRAPAAAAPV